jgi:putative transposase
MWVLHAITCLRLKVATLPLQQYVAHYHEERNHQGKQNRLLFPLPKRGASGQNGIVRCKERLGGLLKYYEREAA